MRCQFETLQRRDLLAADLVTISAANTNNVVVSEDVAYAAAGNDGIVVVDLKSLEVANTVDPPAMSDAVDDIAFADGLLFTMDGSRPGMLSVFSVKDPFMPVLVSGPVSVDVAPFSGVSAAEGKVIVSGGTRSLNVLTYDRDGNLGEAVAQADFGIGQPDVLIDPAGDIAFVSTDFSGQVDGQGFGITVIDVPSPPEVPTAVARVGIDGAGFTLGVEGPANFPIESAVADDLLFVASGSGVSILDVSVPADTKLIDTIELSSPAISVDAFGAELFVVSNGRNPILTIVDLSNGDGRTLEEISLPEGSEPLGVAAFPNGVVIADAALGMLVYRTATTDALVGDIDGDGMVAFSDFLVLSQSFGREVAPLTEGDLTGDGLVGFDDFLILAFNFGLGRN